jgi:hypothetical protein
MTRTTTFALAMCLTAWLAATPAAFADVYKCAGTGGVPIYQEEPCPKGKELRNFQVDPPEITVLPAPEFTNPGTKRTERNAARSNATAKEAKAPKPSTPAGHAEERKHVRSGMSEAEVIARLGQPDVTSGNKKSKGARWTYLPAPGDPDTITSLTFANGVVTNVERRLYRK